MMQSPAPLSPSDQGLQAVFTQFASFGSGTGPRDAAKVEMDGARLVKLCREAGLIGGKVNATSVDIIFSKVKTKVRPAMFPNWSSMSEQG